MEILRVESESFSDLIRDEYTFEIVKNDECFELKDKILFIEINEIGSDTNNYAVAEVTNTSTYKQKSDFIVLGLKILHIHQELTSVEFEESIIYKTVINEKYKTVINEKIESVEEKEKTDIYNFLGIMKRINLLVDYDVNKDKNYIYIDFQKDIFDSQERGLKSILQTIIGKELKDFKIVE